MLEPYVKLFSVGETNHLIHEVLTVETLPTKPLVILYYFMYLGFPCFTRS